MKTTITLEGVSLDVEYTYYPGHKGMRDSLGGRTNAGPPLEPDEPASIEVESITSTENLLDLFPRKIVEDIEQTIRRERQ